MQVKGCERKGHQRLEEGRLGGPVANLWREHKSNEGDSYSALCGDCHMGMKPPCGQVYQVVSKTLEIEVFG